MSDRERLPEFIDRYNNGELNGEELTIFLSMLKENPQLKEEIRLDKELNTVLMDEDLLDLRKKILTIRRRGGNSKNPDLRLLLLAASLLVFLAVEFLLFYSKEEGLLPFRMNQERIAHKSPPPAPKAPVNSRFTIAVPPQKQDLATPGNPTKKDQQIPVNFRENPAYENLIGASRYAGHFRMITPKEEERFQSTAIIRFEWTGEKDSGISLTIFNNMGKRIRESGMILDNNYSIRPGTLHGGLYYFEVLHKEEIIFFGKFTIEEKHPGLLK